MTDIPATPLPVLEPTPTVVLADPPLVTETPIAQPIAVVTEPPPPPSEAAAKPLLPEVPPEDAKLEEAPGDFPQAKSRHAALTPQAPFVAEQRGIHNDHEAEQLNEEELARFEGQYQGPGAGRFRDAALKLPHEQLRDLHPAPKPVVARARTSPEGEGDGNG